MEEKKGFREYHVRSIEEQASAAGANAIVGYRISSFTEADFERTICYGTIRYGTAVFYTENE